MDCKLYIRRHVSRIIYGNPVSVLLLAASCQHVCKVLWHIIGYCWQRLKTNILWTSCIFILQLPRVMHVFKWSVLWALWACSNLDCGRGGSWRLIPQLHTDNRSCETWGHSDWMPHCCDKNFSPMWRWVTLRFPRIIMNFASSVPHCSSPAAYSS